MSCSPLLKGAKTPTDVLQVFKDHPVLGSSEPPQTFYELAERGWVVYERGCWRITEEGRREAKSSPAPEKTTRRPEPGQMSLADLFDL